MRGFLRLGRVFLARYRRALLVAGGSALACVIAVAFVLALWGDRITMAMWNNFHVLPKVVTYFNPDHAGLLVSIGYYKFNTFGRSNYDLDEAERYLYRALELDPMVPTAWHQLARIDFLRGNLGAALLKENRQLELHGDSFMPAYYIRGLVYAFGEQYEKAERDFLRYLEHDPHSWAAVNDLAWVHFEQGEYAQVLEYAERGLAAAPENPWLLMMQGAALINLDRKDEARAPLERALAEARALTREDWIIAYPGNNPAIAEQGLGEMLAAIEANLALVD